jgi:hypothetical protein
MHLKKLLLIPRLRSLTQRDLKESLKMRRKLARIRLHMR